jgi:hypothetical protein
MVAKKLSSELARLFIRVDARARERLAGGPGQPMLLRSLLVVSLGMAPMSLQLRPSREHRP